MNAPVDTLAFAERFESAGFGHDQARVLAAAFGSAREETREGLVTKDHLDARLAEMEARLTRELTTTKTELIREMAAVGKDVSNRLWSTVAIIAGVSTAISATIAAGVALLLKAGGI